mmetsp:Transcript_61908/g.170451  ORF Transcript_61908/g.170451 Transcript_61908/m.170451 type:complete len:408 (+) Transcript_61908:304-1527(+)
MSESNAAPVSKRPLDTPFRQQRLPAWQPILTPQMVAVLFLTLAIPFIGLGSVVLQESDAVVEYVKQYDGSGVSSELESCKIDNAGLCNITFDIKDDMEAPVYLYYQLTNFYQNHRRYAKSYLADQLLGTVYQSGSTALAYCDPLSKNGSLILNPCGLIANTLFNDKITLATTSGTSGHPKLDTTGIAWPSDKSDKFAQPVSYCKKADSGSYSCGDGVKTGTDYEFAKASSTESVVGGCLGSVCSDSICGSVGLPDGCKGYHCDEPDYYNCDEGYYAYYYPEDDYQQYLYETFPEVVSPLEGATNEHFIVWMRTAALPTFRKLYGVIDSDLKKGSSITIQVEANFDVTGFEGTKSLVLSTVTWFGGKNSFFGVAFLLVGSICLVVGIALEFNLLYNGPRKAGDKIYLD